MADPDDIRPQPTYSLGPAIPRHRKPRRPGRIEMMQKQLGLSDAQASKIRDLFANGDREISRLNDRIKVESDYLVKKLQLGYSDSEIQNSVDELNKDEKKIQAIQNRVRDDMKLILNPVQQAKFVLGGLRNNPNNHPVMGRRPSGAAPRAKQPAMNRQNSNQKQPSGSGSAPSQSEPEK